MTFQSASSIQYDIGRQEDCTVISLNGSESLYNLYMRLERLERIVEQTDLSIEEKYGDWA